MPRDRVTLNLEQAPLAVRALAQLIEETLGANPRRAKPEPLTMAELKSAVSAHSRLVEQLAAE